MSLWFSNYIKTRHLCILKRLLFSMILANVIFHNLTSIKDELLVYALWQVIYYYFYLFLILKVYVKKNECGVHYLVTHPFML